MLECELGSENFDSIKAAACEKALITGVFTNANAS